MGTRADFYVGRGEAAEWLGSIAWDGYVEGLEPALLEAATEAAWRSLVAELLAGREDWTKPEDGWPWPWKDSQTTDYAYAFDGGKVSASCFGCAWFDPLKPPADMDAHMEAGEKAAAFPDMTARQRVTMGRRSGVLFLTAKAEGK